ncbi:MAG: glycoside hydrolase family 97 protein [Flavisolibacter sp.]|nr:glycoside hydrolase family 97 protein [Flavisolibacter sp.]
MYKAYRLIIVFSFFCSSVFAKQYELLSPDKRVKIVISVTDKITWSVWFDRQVMLEPGQLAMNFAHGFHLGQNPSVVQEKRTSRDEMITAVVPVKRRLSRDHYNELSLSFKGNYILRLRAYNEGAAYRFETSLKEQEVQVVSETCDFRFPSNYLVFWPTEADTAFQSHFENFFKDTVVSAFSNKQHGNLPMLLTTPSQVRLLITEADLYDYPNMFLYGSSSNYVTAGFPRVIKGSQPRGDRGIRITELANYIASTKGRRTYPWRIVSISSDDKQILENNLVYQLSSPNILKDVSWIKPGKVAWDWWNANNIYGVDFEAGLNTETYKYYIDFASAFGLEYIILDEGWSHTTTDVLQARKEIDIEELVRYSASKNVGVILWTLWGPLDKDLDNILDKFVQWGAKGIKVDFMARADQYMVNYYERVADAAAKRKLLVDFHGAYKPVGLNRKYPNVISFEGVRGMENCKWEDNITPVHNVTLPFTRMVAGPMDYTPGAMLNANKDNFRIVFTEPMSMGTRAHQASMYVLYESPLQMLADNPSNYWRDTAYTRFIASIPTVWDTTIALHAKAGQYLVTARKNGNKWYIGAMSDFTKRELQLPLSFLNNGNYKMTFIADGANTSRHASDYRKDNQMVSKGDTITINLESGGGWAAILTPADN